MGVLWHEGYRMRNVFVETGAALAEANVGAKIKQTHDITRRWQRNTYLPDHGAPLLSVQEAGRPEQPRLVHPRDLPKRGFGLPFTHKSHHRTLAHGSDQGAVRSQWWFHWQA